MRIISGELGGRRINPPAQMPYTRPTTDVAKEGLFNILQNRMSFDGIATLDLFGGTGSISYEMASRGAASLTVIEKDAQMYAFIKKNIVALNIQNCQVLMMDAFQYLTNCTMQFDFIFAGPPYALTNIDEIPKLVMAKQLLLPNGFFVLEHTPRNNYESYDDFQFQRNYGTTVFSFFMNKKKE